MSELFFRYVKQGEAAPLRVLASRADQYLTDGFTETDFGDWWENGVADDSKAAWSEGSEDGEFWAEVLDPDTNEIVKVACSEESGEPIEVEASEEESEETAEEPAPAADDSSAETPTEAPAEETASVEAPPAEEEVETAEGSLE